MGIDGQNSRRLKRIAFGYRKLEKRRPIFFKFISIFNESVIYNSRKSSLFVMWP